MLVAFPLAILATATAGSWPRCSALTRRALHDPVAGAVRVPRTRSRFGLQPTHRAGRAGDLRPAGPGAQHPRRAGRCAGGRPGGGPKGMGYGRARMLWQVEVPVALPTIMAGVRVATVSTVALVTVGVVVGYGRPRRADLPRLPEQLLPSAEIMTASVLTVALGLTLDVLLACATRLMTPWSAGRSWSVGRRGAGADEQLRRRVRLAERPAELAGADRVCRYLTYEHLYITGFAVLIAAVIALPLALGLGHTGPWRRLHRGGVQRVAGDADPGAADHLRRDRDRLRQPRHDHRAGRLRDPAAADQHLRRHPRGRPRRGRGGAGDGHVGSGRCCCGSSCRSPCR